MAVYANHELADFLRSHRTYREYAKGDLILSQDDAITRVMMVERGFVKMYDIDSAGNERIINLFGHGSIFPIAWLLQDLPKGNFYFYEALSAARCVVADIHEVRAYVREHPQMMFELADHLVRSYVNLASRIQNLEKSRVGERLEFVLLQLATRLGDISGSVARIDAAITQEDIASLAGVTRESLSLEINQRDGRPYWREAHQTFIQLDSLPDGLPVVMRD